MPKGKISYLARALEDVDEEVAVVFIGTQVDGEQEQETLVRRGMALHDLLAELRYREKLCELARAHNARMMTYFRVAIFVLGKGSAVASFSAAWNVFQASFNNTVAVLVGLAGLISTLLTAIARLFSYASREESFREASVKFKFLRKDVEDKETDMDVHAWEKIEYTMCDIMKRLPHFPRSVLVKKWVKTKALTPMEPNPDFLKPYAYRMKRNLNIDTLNDMDADPDFLEPNAYRDKILDCKFPPAVENYLLDIFEEKQQKEIPTCGAVCVSPAFKDNCDLHGDIIDCKKKRAEDFASVVHPFEPEWNPVTVDQTVTATTLGTTTPGKAAPAMLASGTKFGSGEEVEKFTETRDRGKERTGSDADEDDKKTSSNHLLQAARYAMRLSMEDFEHGDSGRRMKAIDKFHHTLEYHHNLFRLAFDTDKKRLRLVTIPILILGTIAGFLSFLAGSSVISEPQHQATINGIVGFVLTLSTFLSDLSDYFNFGGRSECFFSATIAIQNIVDRFEFEDKREDVGGEEMNAQLFKNMQESLVDIVQALKWCPTPDEILQWQVSGQLPLDPESNRVDQDKKLKPYARELHSTLGVVWLPQIVNLLDPHFEACRVPEDIKKHLKAERERLQKAMRPTNAVIGLLCQGKDFWIEKLRPMLEPSLSEKGIEWEEFVELIDKITVGDLKRFAATGDVTPIFMKLATDQIVIQKVLADLRPKLESKLAVIQAGAQGGVEQVGQMSNDAWNNVSQKLAQEIPKMGLKFDDLKKLVTDRDASVLEVKFKELVGQAPQVMQVAV